MESLSVHGATYSATSGFPSTGFVNALFDIILGDGLDNADYNWSSSASWITPDANGTVRFTGQGTSEIVSIIGSPKSGTGSSYRFQFSLVSWFVFKNGAM